MVMPRCLSWQLTLQKHERKRTTTQFSEGGFATGVQSCCAGKRESRADRGRRDVACSSTTRCIEVEEKCDVAPGGFVLASAALER